MAHWLELTTILDTRGSMTIIDRVLPFDIKRLRYVYNVTAPRGGHRHIKTIQALICIKGSCDVFINNGENKQTFLMNNPDKCLIIEPKDWHTMDNFTQDAVLLIISSDHYDPEDYINEPYPDQA